MRMSKTESLRKDLEIMSQNHEREVDMKDAIIQMLDRDLDEAEEQYQTGHRSHTLNIDTLVDLFQQKVQQLEYEFEASLRSLSNDCENERSAVKTKHNADRSELCDILELTEMRNNEQEAEDRHHRARERHQIRS